MKGTRKKRNATLSRGYYTIENQDTPSPKWGIVRLKSLPDLRRPAFASLPRDSSKEKLARSQRARANLVAAGWKALREVVDARPFQLYTLPMISAHPCLMTIDSRGFAVGPEGMRMR